ncbi:MAG TPA: UDP-N-acetylmuramoyl-L-alanine--D-glutamate ligase [Acidimicrobiia bacterium]
MKVLVLGAAVSGKAAAALARRLGHDVTVYDESPEQVAGIDADRVATGEWDDGLLEGVEVVVTSPGIPEGAAPIRAVIESGTPLWSEMEFAARHLDIPYGAVTATNGKTTVTQAAAQMLAVSGMHAVAAGNIGTALSDVVGSDAEVAVVEASSFQLRFIDEFRPDGAVLLNIAPDHLDWHATFEGYVAAKRRIAENQAAVDLLVYDADDPGASAAVEGLRPRLVPVSGGRLPVGGAGPQGDDLVVIDERFPLPDGGPVHVVDMAAAAVLARHLGATREGIERVLEVFTPARHRRTVVGTWDGVAWVNDSKATNPHAAVAAASAYPSVVLIAGGRNKGLDLSPLGAVPSVKAVIAIGEAADELAGSVAAGKFHRAPSLAAAIALADHLARAGDTVLLAPACASFDMFSSYGERGDAFTRLVTTRKEGSRG